MNAQAPACLRVEFIKFCSLAEAVFRGKQEIISLRAQLHADDLIILFQTDTVDAHRSTSGRAHVLLMETDCHTLSRGKENFLVAARIFYLDHVIVILQRDRRQTCLPHVTEIRNRRLLHNTLLCRHKNILVFPELRDRYDSADLFTGHQLEKIDDCRTSGRSAGLRNLIGFQRIGASEVRVEHQIIMGTRHKNIFDVIFRQVLGTLDSLAAAVLAVKIIGIHPFDIAEMRHRDHRIFHRDQVLRRDLRCIMHDFGATVIAVFF